MAGITRLALASALLALSALSAPAQEPEAPGAPAEAVSAETLQGLVSDIQDPERRQQLVERLQALIRAAEAGAAGPGAAEEEATAPEAGAIEAMVAFFRDLSGEASETIGGVVDQVATVPGRLDELTQLFADPERRAALLEDTAFVGVLAACAIAAYALTSWLLRRLRNALVRAGTDRPLNRLARLWRLALRLVVALVPPLAALGVALLGISAVSIAPASGAVALAFASFIALRGAWTAIVQAVLAPEDANVRLVPVGDDPVTALALSLRRAGTFAIAGFLSIGVVRALGAEPDLLRALRGLYALALLVLGVVLVIRYRRWPASDTEGEETLPAPAVGDEPPPSGIRGWQASLHAALRLWWVVALVYMFGLYTLWSSGIEGAFQHALAATGITLVCIAAGFAIYALGSAGLRALGSRLASATRRLPTVRRRIPRYLTGARIVLGVAIGIVVAGFALEGWGVSSSRVLDSELLRNAIGAALAVVAVLFLAFATIDVSTALTESYLHRKQRLAADSAKLRTLVPLAQKAIKLVVWVLASLMVLGQLGVSIGPILASIGVLGLAVGFGAQTLVKDIITGVFILLEDAVSVGDIVMIDGTGGLVEAINIRTIRLRDLSGNVHTIPYSTVGQFANLTKEFSCYLIECGVAYREDVDEVIGILKELGAEMQADPEYGPRILEPIEIFGLDRFEDSAVIVRARLKTKPIEQWSVGREFNRRMKRTFDERGIEIPFPHRTIYVGEGKDGSSPPLRIRGAEEEALVVRSGEGAGDGGDR